MNQVTGADYMEWAKQVPGRARYNLAQSGIRSVTREELDLRLEEIELNATTHGNEYGDERLRAALAGRQGMQAEQCLLAEGTSMVNMLLAGALLKAGDVAVTEVPGYEPLSRISEYSGARVVRLPRRFEDGFQPDGAALGEALKAGARVVWLTNLHNPSGALMSRATLERIYAEVEQAGAWLVVDEVYREFLPDEPGAASLGPRAITTNSFTKVYGLSGLRIGWALGDVEVMDRARRLHGIFAAQTAYPSVCVALAAAPKLDALAERARRICSEGRAVLDAWLPLHPGLREVKPAAGLVSLPKLPAGMDDRELVKRLLEKYDTVVVPGSYFDAPGHIRLAVGAPVEELREGLERLGAALQG